MIFANSYASLFLTKNLCVNIPTERDGVGFINSTIFRLSSIGKSKEAKKGIIVIPSLDFVNRNKLSIEPDSNSKFNSDLLD